jgi:hypothetical protein
MKYRFKTHYTRDQARALLPHVRLWLRRIFQLRATLVKSEEHLGQKMIQGNDVGGPEVNAWLRSVADMQEVLREFERREIQLKDLDRGLVDFPAILDGREVFLCWERDEDDIEFWHDLDAGYAGRERL